MLLAALALTVTAAIVVGVALRLQAVARNEVVDVLDPTSLGIEQLRGAAVDQETGVRGYALEDNLALLEPYVLGQERQTEILDQIRTQLVAIDEILQPTGGPTERGARSAGAFQLVITIGYDDRGLGSRRDGEDEGHRDQGSLVHDLRVPLDHRRFPDHTKLDKLTAPGTCRGRPALRCRCCCHHSFRCRACGCPSRPASSTAWRDCTRSTATT